jgi:hypothetical protein
MYKQKSAEDDDESDDDSQKEEEVETEAPVQIETKKSINVE